MPKMTFAEFSTRHMPSIQDIYRDIFRANRHHITVKKEAVAVKNISNIYNATLKLSSRKGFHAMSLRDLAKETKLSLGALYAYISSKEQLLKVIQTHGVRITKHVLDSEIQTHDDPVEKLRAAIRTHIFLSEIMQSWFYFFYMEAKNLSRQEQKQAIAGELQTEQIFVDIIRQGTTAGCFAKVDPLMTASIIKAMVQDWYLKRWKYSGRHVTADYFADFVCGMVERHIRETGR